MRPDPLLPPRQTEVGEWMWTRFHADPDDYRPVYRVEDGTPGLGPYWCSGQGEGYSIVCAWTQPDLDVRTYWPEASHITQEGPMQMEFTDRFPKPDRWPLSDARRSERAPGWFAYLAWEAWTRTGWRWLARWARPLDWTKDWPTR